MKSSFYFVIWIIIYPILGLIGSQFVDNNSFIIALLIVWALGRILSRAMPETLTYGHATEVLPIAENIYIGNIKAFIKRLSVDTMVEVVNSIYFIVTTFVIGLLFSKTGANDWLALIVFGGFSAFGISRAVKMNKELSKVRENPCEEQCAEAVSKIYGIKYFAYQQERQNFSYEQMLAGQPRHFKAFQVFSLVMAGACSLLGIIYLILSAYAMLTMFDVALSTIAIMYLLYGSLATYYGIRDFVTIRRSLKSLNTNNYEISDEL